MDLLHGNFLYFSFIILQKQINCSYRNIIFQENSDDSIIEKKERIDVDKFMIYKNT